MGQPKTKQYVGYRHVSAPHRSYA